MPQQLETQHVFVDTEIFIGELFNYQSKDLKRLAKLAESNQVFVHLTSVTVNEVKANIAEYLSKGVSALKKFKSARESKVLNGLSDLYKNLFADRVEIKEALPVLVQQFQTYCETLQADVLIVEGVSIEEVFHKYFNQIAPFGSGDKKAEFPDAFVVGTLREWCKKNDEKLYVISNDNDFMTACENEDALIPLRELSDFLDILSAHLETERYNLADKILRLYLREIKERIAETVRDIPFYLDEEGGEVYRVTVKTVDIIRQDIIDISDSQATYSLTAKVDYSAEVTYADNSIEGYIVSTDQQTINRSLEAKIDVIIDIDIQNPEASDIREVNVRTRNVILSLWEPDPYAYK